MSVFWQSSIRPACPTFIISHPLLPLCICDSKPAPVQIQTNWHTSRSPCPFLFHTLTNFYFSYLSIWISVEIKASETCLYWSPSVFLSCHSARVCTAVAFCWAWLHCRCSSLDLSVKQLIAHKAAVWETGRQGDTELALSAAFHPQIPLRACLVQPLRVLPILQLDWTLLLD